MCHPVRDAGLGLALLYMTVLGFDYITWGYCILQGVSESVLGLPTRVSAVVGILGLWIADLAVQQIFQENVAEEERGKDHFSNIYFSCIFFRCFVWCSYWTSERNGLSLGYWTSSSTHFWYSDHCIFHGN